MKTEDAEIAVRAAMSVASSVGLRSDEAVVLRDSDKLIVRLLPSDVVARIAYTGREVASFEVELAERLAKAGGPVAPLEPRVEPAVHRRDGFTITFWKHFESLPPLDIAPDEYADALHRLHAAMRDVDLRATRFTDRVAGAVSLVSDPEQSPDPSDADREFLGGVLRRFEEKVEAHGAADQLLHAEPHAGNVLRTDEGLLFIDLETCCRGPVEFDIAHAGTLDGSPGDLAEAVAERYPGADLGLVRECHVLMLALITAWRWHRDDELPDGQRLGREWLRQLRTLVD